MDTLNPLDIPDVLKKLTASGLTQRAIGDEIGCRQSSVSEMRSGKIGKKRPSSAIVDALRALARKHGITTSAACPRKPGSTPTKTTESAI